MNMSGAERVLRVVAGLALAVAGPLLARPVVDGAVGIAVWALVVVGVADLVVSGLTGYCPVYHHVRAPWARRGDR